MKASIAIGLALVASLWMRPGSAAESGPVWYRVEVIVLTHEGGRPDAYPVADLKDFRDLIDPLDRAVAAATQPKDEATDESDGETTDAMPEADDPRQALETIAAIAALENPVPGRTTTQPGTVGPIWPQPYVNLPRLSPEMQEAWDRLETSGQFNPRAWRAWYQKIGRDEQSRPVRIHDRQVLRGDWLLALGGGAAGDANEAITTPLTSPPDSAWRPAPEFRLDGSVRIYQSQFMHAASDLAWRQPLEDDRRPLVREHLDPGPFRQHRLDQSRAIRPDRLEYFDSSWLGILLRVTPMPGAPGAGEVNSGG